MTKPHTTQSNKRWASLLFIAITAIACYVILPQLKYFHTSLTSLRSANLVYIGLAITASLLTSVLAALTYQLLALQPLRYSRTLLVQFASLFTNHLLQAGLGGIGISYRYLRKTKHGSEQAGLIVFLNNLFGAIGHTLLLLVAVIGFHTAWPKFKSIQLSPSILALVVVVAVAVVAGLMLRSTWRQQMRRGGARLLAAVRLYRSRTPWLAGSVVSSMALTLTNIACLFYCLHAVGLTLAFAQCFIVFTAGIIVGTAAPTPGGLGGFEAGLLAGMLSYHLASGPALAAVLLFRLITYWLALAIGAVSFTAATRQHIV
jgi:uncharacterized protein (TIRG00374 family)